MQTMTHPTHPIRPPVVAEPVQQGVATPDAPASATDAFASDEARWAAVQGRDRAADDHFWYSVRSTGVYCRPSCAARPALRKNVAFHDSCAAAEAAGFRPCKRCKPDQPPLEARQALAVAQACRLIEAAGEQGNAPPDLAALADAVGISRYHFHRLFKTHTGVTPKAWADARRAERVRDRLAGSASVTQAMYDAGFNSSGRFYAHSSGQLGMKPGTYRAGGGGERIRFAAARCWLGNILVAATDKGICAVTLGDDPAALVRALQDRFPRAELIGDDPAFAQTLAQVLAALDDPQCGVGLPLDVRGTAFQQRVWQALREVPAGVTLSYSALAERVGSPAAVRAVASACANNEIALLIPCHRIVRLDGSASGYRWGVERKQALLDKERPSPATEDAG